MKKKLLLLLIVLAAATYQANAQTVKKTPAKKNVTKPQPTSKTAVKQPTQRNVALKTNQPEQTANDYKTAVGLKFIYGISVTGKHFIRNNAALEAIVRYRNYGSGVGSEFNFSGLYEYHGGISGAPGLKWYGGGGVYLGQATFDLIDQSAFNYGPTGVLGLEYKFKDIPLALSADWQPVFLINSGGGFTGENGGIGIKYAF